VAATQNRRLLAWEAGHYFMTWDLSGERPGEPQYVGKNIDAFAVHPDGSQVATADDREIIVWRLENGEGVHQLRDQRECCALAWSPDGSRLASGSKNGTIAIWDTASGGLLMHMLSPEHVPIELAWSPDGNCLASAGDDGRIMIRDAKRGWQLWHTRPLAGRRVAQSPFPLVRLRRRSARRPAASVFSVKLQPLRTYLAEHPPALSDQRSLESEIAGLEQALAKMRRPNIGELAVKYYLLGLLHLESGQTMKAYELFSKAGAGWDEMQEDLNDFGAWHSFAWFLANCPQIELRDPERAVGTVDKAILIAKLKSDPSTATNIGAGCLTRALAKYRQGDWQSAIDDLEQSKYFRVVANSLDFFLLAMCHWQLGNRDEALDWYRQGVDDLCEYHGFTTRLAPSGEFPSILEVHRLRAEAESLIGKENIERVVFDDSTESVP
jgi:tetratricopeptide (TPR) repeat protein